jgi:hypothetical protein
MDLARGYLRYTGLALVQCQVAHSTPLETHSAQNASVLRQLACGVDHPLRNIQMGDIEALGPSQVPVGDGSYQG